MKTVYEKAMEEFGENAQALKAIEELGELIVAITQYGFGKCSLQDVASEIADVEIMCSQLRIMFGNDLVDRVKEEKLDRLKIILY